MKLKELNVLNAKTRFYVAGTEYFEGSFDEFKKTKAYEAAKNVADMVKSISLDFDGCIRVDIYPI